MSEIGLGIRSKQTSGSYVRLTLGGGIASTCDELRTNELLYLLHALSRTKYVERSEQSRGFVYTFPIVFG